MLDIAIDTSRLAALNQTLSDYAAVSRKSPGDVVRAKARQLLLGIGPKNEHTPGLYERIAATAPSQGQVTSERSADSWRIGTPRSTSLLWAKERAGNLLGSATSAAYFVRTGVGGALTGVAGGQYYTRGRKKGTLTWGSGRNFRRLKTGVAADTNTMRSSIGRELLSEDARAHGGALLNRQALTVALAVARREHSRLATAAQFLPARFASMFADKGDRTRATVANAKGDALATADFAATTDGAYFQLIGNLGLHTPAQISALNDMLDALTADTAIYIAQKTTDAFPRLT